LESESMGMRINRLRLKNNMTLEELGNKVGVGKSTVRKWENGMIANMRRDKIAKLAAALNVSPGYLMGWNESESTDQPTTDTSTEYDLKIIDIQQKKLNDVYEKLTIQNRDKVYQYTTALLSTQQMEEALLVDAASARTDINISEDTDTSDNDIMDDENF